MRNLVILAAGLLSFISCLAQRPAQPPFSEERFHPFSNGYALVWEDQFNGDKLDTSK